MATATITPIIPTRSRELLDSCLRLAQERLPTLLADVLTQSDDVLFNLANTAGSSMRQNLFFDAMRELRLKRQDIETAFLDNFNRGYADAIDLARTPARRGVSVLSGELTLVGLDEVEENLAVNQFVDSMRTRCSQEIFALEKRLGVLFKAPELDDASNPLGPRAIGEALKRACQRLDANVEVKLTLYKLFDKLASFGLQQLYVELNRRLVQGDILPMLSAQAERAAPARRTRVIIESGQDSVEAAGDDVFSTLQSLMQNAGGHGQGHGNSGAGGGGPSIVGLGNGARHGAYGSNGAGAMGGYATNGFPILDGGAGPGGFAGGGGNSAGHGADYMSVPLLVEALTSLQRGGHGLSNGMGHDLVSGGGSGTDGLINRGTSSGDGSFNGAFEASGVRSGTFNMLRGLRESGVVGQMAPTQDLTLEIVSLLFDYILGDASIPDALKALIGRLQIPVLKVAILDKNVFSKKSHPARRLLDALGSAAVGWHEGLQRSDILYAKIEEVVLQIVNDFDDDVGLFSTVLDDFTTFMERENAAANERADASSRSLHTRERLVLAKLAVDEALHARTRGGEVREFVMQFLFDYWRQLLIITHVEAGLDSDEWRTQLGAVDELVWSVQSKATPEDRKALSSRLPALLKIIKGGMRTLEMAPVDCSRFLSMLASVHVVSIKQIEESSIAARKLARSESPVETSGEQTEAADRTVEIDPASEEFIRQGLARLFERKGVEPVELDFDFSAMEAETVLPEPIDSDAGIETYVELVTTLDLGDWVEFETADGLRIRGRFTWISPTSGRYLFTDLHGEKMQELTMIELAREFQLANASIIRAESDPLLDRALGALIDKLEAESAAA